MERGAVWGLSEDGIRPRVPPGDTPGTQAASNSPALKNPAVATCSRSALPYIPDPTSPPDLAQWGYGVGGAVAWVGGGVMRWISG